MTKGRGVAQIKVPKPHGEHAMGMKEFQYDYCHFV